MPRDALAAATVLKAISDHRWTDAAKWPIVPRIGPQPGLLRLAGSGSERWQGRLVGEDPFALLDLLQHIISQWLQFEADLAHPLRHQRAVEIDAVTRVDRFLPVQRQPVGVFGHRDLGEKRFGRKAALDQMDGGWGLKHAIAVAVDVFRAARNDHAELRRRHVQPPRHILADQDLLQPSQPGGTSGSMTISTRSRCAPNSLRGRAARFGLSWPPALASSASMAAPPVAISSNTKAICSSLGVSLRKRSERVP